MNERYLQERAGCAFAAESATLAFSVLLRLFQRRPLVHRDRDLLRRLPLHPCLHLHDLLAHELRRPSRLSLRQPRRRRLFLCLSLRVLLQQRRQDHLHYNEAEEDIAELHEADDRITSWRCRVAGRTSKFCKFTRKTVMI